MATKRKLEETSTSNLNVAILQYFNKSGLKDSAKALTKEAKLNAKDAANAPNLEDIFNQYKPAVVDSNKKAKVESDSDSDSSDSDSSDSDSSDSDSDESEKKPAAPVAKAAPAKKVESDSDSDSDSSDSDSSDSDDSDSDDDKMKVEKAAPVKAAPIKKEESDSDSDSDSSDSSSSSSSSSDDSSDDEEEEEEVKAPVKTPAKAAASAPQTPATPSAGVFKIYVKGLPWTASDAEVKDFFKDCGKITECELPLDADGRSSGTAYVKFADKSALDAALALDGQTWPGTSRWLKILESNDKGNPKSFGGPAGERPENCDTVFVGNLPWDVTEEQMKEVFASAGEISNVRFATGEDGSFRGFGHVQFYNGEDTVAAVKLTGTQINGRGIRVDYAPPRNRESFGGAPKSPGGRGGRGDGGRGGRGGRGRGDATPNKRTGGIVAGAGSNNKKMTFDE